MGDSGTAAHWDEAYAAGASTRSWFQQQPVMDAWTLISDDREEHQTPAGTVQPFTWAALRKTA